MPFVEKKVIRKNQNGKLHIFFIWQFHLWETIIFEETLGSLVNYFPIFFLLPAEATEEKLIPFK
jgi:hypothetical protein